MCVKCVIIYGLINPQGEQLARSDVVVNINFTNKNILFILTGCLIVHSVQAIIQHQNANTPIPLHYQYCTIPVVMLISSLLYNFISQIWCVDNPFFLNRAADMKQYCMSTN